MALLVFVVGGAGAVEIAQHIGRCVACLFINAMLLDVGMQALQQVQAAAHALVASGQHLKGLVEADRGAGVQEVDA